MKKKMKLKFCNTKTVYMLSDFQMFKRHFYVLQK